jgi:hypothetical protein
MKKTSSDSLLVMMYVHIHRSRAWASIRRY